MTLKYNEKGHAIELVCRKVRREQLPEATPDSIFSRCDYVVAVESVYLTIDHVFEVDRKLKKQIKTQFLSDYSEKSENSIGSKGSIGSNVSSQSTVENKIADFISKQSLHQYIKTPAGSKAFQKYLTNASQSAISTALESIQHQLRLLMEHDYANYAISKLIQVCGQKLRQRVLSLIVKDFFQIACHKKSSLVLQRLIQVSEKSSAAQKVVGYLQQNKRLKQLLNNDVGIHVINKLVKSTSSDYFFNFALQKTCKSLAKLSESQTGSLFVKTLIERSTGNQLWKKMIVESLLAGARVVQLAQGCFSNNVAQQLVISYSLKELIASLQEKFVFYCNHKFSSFVVQKCVFHSNPIIRNRFLQQLAGPGLGQLMKNQYGCKVLNKYLQSGQKVPVLKQAILKVISIGSLPQKIKQKWTQSLKHK